MWSVNTESGYFQLGSPEQNDDLYVMNITLVNARFFDQLLKVKSKSIIDQTEWSVTFDAFGMSIKSDVFKLENKDKARLTYLGDKSTARIRASTAVFSKFLNETTFSMQVETISERKTELVGIGSIPLEPLIRPDVYEIRESITIVPQAFQIRIPDDCCPTLSLVIDVTASLNFYSTYVKLEEIGFPQTLTRSKENLTMTEDVDNASIVVNRNANNNNTSPAAPNVTSAAVVVVESNDEIVPSAGVTNSIVNVVNPELTCSPGEFVFNLRFHTFNIKSRSPLNNDWSISFHHPPLGMKPQDRCVLVAKLDRSKGGSTGTHYFYFEDDEDEDWTLSIPKFTRELLETPLEILFHKDNAGNKSPIVRCKIPIGNIFSQKKTVDGWTLVGDAPVQTFQNGQKVGFLNYTFNLKELSAVKPKVQNSSPVKFSNPIHTRRDKVSTKENESSRTSEFDPFRFARDKEVTPKDSGKSKSHTSDADKSVTKETERSGDSKSYNDSETLHGWRLETEKKFKKSLMEKEQSYLQILATEYKKQKDASEKIVKQKLDECESLKKEAMKKLRSLNDKEEGLNKREKEVEDLARKISLEHTGEIEKLKLENRRLKEEYKIETTSLAKQFEQRLVEYNAEVGKNRILQERLKISDEKYAEMSAMRHKWPEADTQRKLDSLEQKCEQLKKELESASKEKQVYKTQIQNLVKELERKSEESKEQLRNENETLKLQLLASRQQELLSKEMEQVASVSNEIRVVKNHFERQPQPQPLRTNSQNKGGYSKMYTNINTRAVRDHPIIESESVENSPKILCPLIDAEIEKLMKTRESLLKSQAYTPTDPLIRNIEAEIDKKIQQKRDIGNRKNLR